MPVQTIKPVIADLSLGDDFVLSLDTKGNLTAWENNELDQREIPSAATKTQKHLQQDIIMNLPQPVMVKF